MGLYKLFSCNVEVQYRGCLLSKAMLFTIITTLLNIILPFIVAYRSRGFWLRYHSYYEQPMVHSTYNYLLVAETDDPSIIVTCGDAQSLKKDAVDGEEYCAEIQIQEYDYDRDSKNDRLDFKFHINIPPERRITSIILILEMDYQLRATCPLHMQTLTIVNKEFALPSSGFQYYGDIILYQTAHLPCQRNVINTEYNSSIFNYVDENNNENAVDFIMRHFLQREVTTELKTTFSRTSFGHTGSFTISIYLRIPKTKVIYVPSLLQELKWAWPQYLSLALIFYWLFERVKRFVFNNRLFMAWEVLPWKKAD
ncbi:transmembrane protein 231 [Epargyreus clarus]|uniref:transmembrane protein 231 n=1 Tax=Epargyreus clarus TaxID=520877 RepID=UPI003C2D9BB1